MIRKTAQAGGNATRQYPTFPAYGQDRLEGGRLAGGKGCADGGIRRRHSLSPRLSVTDEHIDDLTGIERRARLAGFEAPRPLGLGGGRLAGDSGTRRGRDAARRGIPPTRWLLDPRPFYTLVFIDSRTVTRKLERSGFREALLEEEGQGTSRGSGS
jgi:hypothetical protein